jgi:hypothetical protein
LRGGCNLVTAECSNPLTKKRPDPDLNRGIREETSSPNLRRNRWAIRAYALNKLSLLSVL